MKKYWIVGHPLSFCLCTPVSNGVFKELGFEGHFETHDVAPEDLHLVMEKIRSGELAGAVTTMPHKTPSLAFLDESTDESKAINAVNLVLGHSPNGELPYKLKGYNTDWLGALGAVKSLIPDIKGKHILVLGAGGAARAAAYGFHKEGAVVSIWNRTSERAKAFAEKMQITQIPDMRKWDGEPDIIVNATSASYQPSQSTLVPFPLWKNVQLAMDAVYGKTSLFLEEAKAANVKHIISGDVWFLHQGAPLLEIITGQKAPLGLMKKLTDEAVDIIKS